AAVSIALSGCTSTPPPASSSTPVPTASVPAAPSATPTATPSPTPTATRPVLPAVRWDLVPPGGLPAGCSTVRSTRVYVKDGAVYAKGPSLTCTTGGPYWVRAVMKVAQYHGNGHWTYLTEVHPSTPARDAAVAQRSEHVGCPPGRTVRAVAS